MQYKGYTAKVEFDPDAKLLHGEVLGVRDVITFQASSAKEVEKVFRESVDDYLVFCRERGESPEKPFSGQFLLRVGPNLHRQLSTRAQAAGKSLNAYVAECLSRAATEQRSSPKRVLPPRTRGVA